MKQEPKAWKVEVEGDEAAVFTVIATTCARAASAAEKRKTASQMVVSCILDPEVVVGR